jgi:hypothetical protein
MSLYTVYRRNCIHCTCCCKYKPYDYDYNSSSYWRCTKTFIVHVAVNTNPTITTTTVPPIDGVLQLHVQWMSLYTVYRRNCCSRNRRVCIYNYMYNECLCTPSIGGTVVVVIVGFVNSSSYRQCTKTFIVHVVVNTNPTITTTTVPPIDSVQRHYECLCTPSIGGTVVVVIVGFVFRTTCTMNVFVHRL